METTYLREYVKVADCGSFTAAARELHLTQSALSKHVAALEREFGVELFVRDRSGIKLTQAGKTLYQQAVQICQTLHQTRALLRTVSVATPAAAPGFAECAVAEDRPLRNTALRCKCQRVAERCGLSKQESGALMLYLEEHSFKAIQAELGVTRDQLAETLGQVYRKMGVSNKQKALDFVHAVS